MEKKKEEMWAISFKQGRGSREREILYYCTFPTKKDAIRAHTDAFGRDWDYCSKNGDRAVKVLVQIL